jgi:hypothetical protein
MKSSNIILYAMFVLALNYSISAGERLQVEPNSFNTINLRYEQLKQTDYEPLDRPWFLFNRDPNQIFLLRLQPTLTPNHHAHDAGLKSWIQLNLTNNIVVINEMLLNYASQNDSSYLGKEWRGGSGLTNQAFVHWKKRLALRSDLVVQAGRFYSQLGPGRHGQLLLGVGSRPMDQLSLSINKPIKKNLSARFSYQTTALDKIGSTKRFLSLHRLEIAGKKGYIAVSEGLAYTRKDQGIDLVYLNPFLFYHGEQLNGPNLSGNTIGSIDFGFKWNTHHIYSEIIVDDVQLDNDVIGDLEPNEVGALFGYEFAGPDYYLSIEGVSITNRTYKTPDRSEWFLHRNEPIGYELGSDIARVNVLSRFYPMKLWHIDAEVDLVWQGEGDFSHAWDSPWINDSVTIMTGYSEPFPTGIVENTRRFSLEVMRHWDQERWLGLGIVYESIVNANHSAGFDEQSWHILATASWTFDYAINIDDQ